MLARSTTFYVPLAQASRRSPARLTLGPERLTSVLIILLKLYVFKDVFVVQYYLKVSAKNQFKKLIIMLQPNEVVSLLIEH